MTFGRKLRRQQRHWAQAAKLQPDSRGYLGTVERNLFRPLSASTLAEFRERGGAELLPDGARPAKMRALHSSAILVVNVFDHWVRHDPAPLADALGLDAPITLLSFEARFPTGLPQSIPTLDVALELGSGWVVGIESKFGEWLVPRRRSVAPFKAKYFDGGIELWARHGLPRCQDLAAAMMRGEATFRFLDAPQLLKQALGLAIDRPRRFAVCYLYEEVDSPALAVHREEIRRFGASVGAEISFKVVTYRELYRSLRLRTEVDPEYLAYLGARYGWR